MIKKIAKRIGCFLIIILLILGILYEVLLQIFGCPAGYNSDTLIQHTNSYRIIADAVYNDFSKYQTEVLWYMLSDDGNLHCRSKNNEHILYLDEEAAAALKDLRESYHLDKQVLEFIDVREGFVSFSNINMRAEFIYSVTGKKPKGLGGKYTPFNQYRIARIDGNLYFVAKLHLRLW